MSHPAIQVLVHPEDGLLPAGRSDGIEVADGDQAKQTPLAVHHRQVADAPRHHRAPGLLDWRLRRAADDLGRHHLRDGCRGRGPLLADDTPQHVALGEHACDVVPLHHDEGADLVFVHDLSCLKHGRLLPNRPDPRPFSRQDVFDCCHALDPPTRRCPPDPNTTLVTALFSPHANGMPGPAVRSEEVLWSAAVSAALDLSFCSVWNHAGGSPETRAKRHIESGGDRRTPKSHDLFGSNSSCRHGPLPASPVRPCPVSVRIWSSLHRLAGMSSCEYTRSHRGVGTISSAAPGLAPQLPLGERWDQWSAG